MVRWMMRTDMEEIEVHEHYAGHPNIFFIKLFYGGEFTRFSGRKYINGKQKYVDLVDIDVFCVHDIDDMMEFLGCVEEDTLLYYHFKMPLRDLDFGMHALASDQDICHLRTYVDRHKLIEVYIEHGLTRLHTYAMSPNPSRVRIEEIRETPARRLLLTRGPDKTGETSGSSKGPEPEQHNPPIVNVEVEPEQQNSQNCDPFETDIDLDNIADLFDTPTMQTLSGDYILELQTRNPQTTVKLDVESEANPASETRIFKRIYICLGALKKGFLAGKRDYLGLDGAFIKGPYTGMTAVGLDGNNHTYPLAYAMVESENINSWKWFLSCLGDDLDLCTNSNFTFITDRQKGVLQAISTLFPCAENRFCLRHIHENMKQKWRGKVFKDLLWKCATSSTMQQFNQAMEEMKELNKDCYEWLKDIPPQHWARSHFTGRAHCDGLLNNLCESFNKQLVDAREQPIVTCLEFIREYLMKRLVTVQKGIDKAVGPLTPTATKLLEKIKEVASQYVGVFGGNGKYQVTGPWGDQCVVDINQHTCSCRKWELTSMPCKHAVVAIWDMRKNNQDIGLPETLVHQTYWLKTWRDMYTFKIEPINGKKMWAKSPCPTTLLPLVHRVPIGRPKKKRRKGALEMEDMVQGNKASRKHKTVTCSKCKSLVHNARSCKVESASTSKAAEKSVGAGGGKGGGKKGAGTSKGGGKKGPGSSKGGRKKGAGGGKGGGKKAPSSSNGAVKCTNA